MSIYSFDKPAETSPDQTPIPVDADRVSENEKNEAIKKIAEQEGKDQGKEKVVVIEGPLSHTYTQALNIALANESVSFMLNRAPEAPQNTSETGDANNDAEYVYVIGDKVTDKHVATEAYNALAKAKNSGKYKRIHLAVEGVTSGKACKNIHFAVEAALGLGVNVIAKGNFGMEAAVLSLSDAIRSSNV